MPIRTPLSLYKTVKFIVEEVLDMQYTNNNNNNNNNKFIIPTYKDEVDGSIRTGHTFKRIYEFSKDRVRAVL